MSVKIVGTFSYTMFEGKMFNLSITKVSKEVVAALDPVSHIGYETTAHFISNILGKEYLQNRAPIKILPGDILIHAVTLNQSGMRATTLEEAMKLQPYKDYDMEFYLIQVDYEK